MLQEKRNNKILNLTKVVMMFFFIAGSLIMTSVLQSLTTQIFNASIESNIAFAQEQTPAEIISAVKSLLNQTLSEYRNQNFTGAQGLASSAYLDQFEFIEAPLDKHEKALKENTELMLREQLRQYIKDKSPLENIQQLINNINSNLDKAQALLANEPPIQTIATTESSSAIATNQTNQTTTSSIASKATEVRIIGDEVKQPYIPGSVIIQSGDKVKWINSDEEVHTVTSGLGSEDSGKQFDSGLLSANQTFDHTFDKPGTYNYYCSVHPIMTGLVNVN